jgi:hypothetical protein
VSEEIKQGSSPASKKFDINPEDYVTQYGPQNRKDREGSNQVKSGGSSGRMLESYRIPAAARTENHELNASEKVGESSVHPAQNTSERSAVERIWVKSNGVFVGAAPMMVVTD